MKKTKFTESQIVFALKQADSGVKIQEVCRQMGVSEATFYNWKKKYGGLGMSELRQLKQLQDENAKLKQIVADLSLDKQMLQDVLKKIFENPSTTAVGNPFNCRLPGIPSKSLPRSLHALVQLALPFAPPRRSAPSPTNARDCRGEGQIWDVADLHTVTQRGV
ncbi:Transposase [Chitinophaga costaii]|uniref:Transposase n=1 Tax=Chitinophaga costaii TaxID=1335309 RepID=A0A1C3YUU7_9BACT|nr:Transposase [Chitinophaga costaii]